MIKVAICGAAGRMGREVLKTVVNAEDMELCAAIDLHQVGSDAGVLLNGTNLGVKITSDLSESLTVSGAEVMVDFTDTRSVGANVLTALKAGVRPVVGATGMSEEEFATITQMVEHMRLGCIIAPNFTVGALLMIKFAAEAAKYFPHVEIIERHHDQKLDAPSGTSIKTAEQILAQRGDFQQGLSTEEEKISGVRGGLLPGGLRIHSVRLPGYVANQEVIFGGTGQVLTIKHDTTSRESFMPGVLVAIRAVMHKNELIYGLENVLFDA